MLDLGKKLKVAREIILPFLCLHFAEKEAKNSCLFFQVNVHVLCTQDDTFPQWRRGVR